jgi:D-sedoheptulose 7-phosphate isomerase
MSDFLYPFIDGDGEDATVLLRDLAASAVAKAAVSTSLQAASLSANAATIDAAAQAMATQFEAGGRLLTFGNGGSSTDAAGLAELFARPPWGTPLPARSLVDDQAVLTALGNDVGFELVFARQVIAHGREGDMALGISTSGTSRNVLAALAEAASRGMVTIGLAGYDGGEFARSPFLSHCLVVEADSIHRIQESQATLGFALWDAVQVRIAAAVHG